MSIALTEPVGPTRRGATRDDAGAARNVQDTFARLHVGRAEQLDRYRSCDGGDEVALVVLGGAAREAAVRNGAHAIASLSSGPHGRSIDASAA